jgi:hypothetical protein
MRVGEFLGVKPGSPRVSTLETSLNVRTEHRLEAYACYIGLSGLVERSPSASQELSPCTWSNDATALM